MGKSEKMCQEQLLTGLEILAPNFMCPFMRLDGSLSMVLDFPFQHQGQVMQPSTLYSLGQIANYRLAGPQTRTFMYEQEHTLHLSIKTGGKINSFVQAGVFASRPVQLLMLLLNCC